MFDFAPKFLPKGTTVTTEEVLPHMCGESHPTDRLTRGDNEACILRVSDEDHWPLIQYHVREGEEIMING